MTGPQPVYGAVRLADLDPAATPGAHGRHDAERDSARHAKSLDDLQERMYAASTTGGTTAVLLVLQAMDTAGKGGIVRHVVGMLDPQGVQLHAFKAPTADERAHDFLWRIRPHLPSPGRVGVWDRSHYEDVLIARVRDLAPAAEIERRYGAIVEFEQEVVASGTAIVKVMLHISRDEQRDRLAGRLDRPDKWWKYNPGDVTERARWDDYMAAYEIAIERTSTPEAPWFVVPADHKWYARWAVQHLVHATLHRLDPQWPSAGFDVPTERARLAAT